MNLSKKIKKSDQPGLNRYLLRNKVLFKDQIILKPQRSKAKPFFNSIKQRFWFYKSI